MAGWIGVDLDGTIAEYPVPISAIGKPIPRMVQRVKRWLADGTEVRIVTARVGQCDSTNPDGIVDDEAFTDAQRSMIEAWCEEHLGCKLKVTCRKDFEMLELWDDRSIQVVSNTGLSIVEHMARHV